MMPGATAPRSTAWLRRCGIAGPTAAARTRFPRVRWATRAVPTGERPGMLYAAAISGTLDFGAGADFLRGPGEAPVAAANTSSAAGAAGAAGVDAAFVAVGFCGFGARSSSNGVWTAQFTGRSNWLYTLVRSTDFQSWTNLPSTPGVSGTVVLTDSNAPVGKAFYRVKARTIHAICGQLLDRYGGEVPSKLATLLELPGVGRKTVRLSHERRPCGFPDAGVDPGEDERREEVRRGHE